MNARIKLERATEKPVGNYQSTLIQERAEGRRELRIFGSPQNVNDIGAEFITTSYVKKPVKQGNFTISIGSPQCSKPFDASILNCSALSFGPMGKKFILACNKAAYKQGFFQNTGEAGISPYHLGFDVNIEHPDFNLLDFFKEVHHYDYQGLNESGSIVWQIGSGYYGCRTKEGLFDEEIFALKSQLPNVVMIEIKLSQGLEPCKALPMKQLTPGVAQVLSVHPTERVALPHQHQEFSSPKELLFFVAKLRRLSGGKPVGIKLALSRRREFLGICKAMIKTGIIPDFLTIDGMEGGTSGTHQGIAGFVGMPLSEALLFVHNALTGIKLRQHIRIIASGRVFSEQDIISKLAIGADLCTSARAILISAGCTQQMECNKGTCIRGIATQDARLLKQFDTTVATTKIVNYHRITLEELAEILSVCGLSHPKEITPDLVYKRISSTEVKPLSEIYEFLRPGELRLPFLWRAPKSFRREWLHASYEKFS
jgi:glutamate synthase domain-containing protein 2